MAWKRAGLWLLMVIAVGAAADKDSAGGGVALAVLIGAHVVAAAIREK